MNSLLKRSLESGETLEMIYLSNNNEISQRKIKVIEIYAETFRAYCFTRRQPRIFKISNVLSIGPVRKRFREEVAS
jgi:predicted DNA-binding transcriptional regulator YafY